MKCQYLFVAVLAAAVALTVTGRAEDKKPEKGPVNYVHVVVFTVKKDAPKDAVSAAIADQGEQCKRCRREVPSRKISS